MQLGYARIRAIVLSLCLLTTLIAANFHAAVAVDGGKPTISSSSSSSSSSSIPIFRKQVISGRANSVAGDGHGVWDVQERGESGGESSPSSTIAWLQGAVRSVSDRILRIQHVTEEPAWPPLNFGWRTIAGVVCGGLGAALSSSGGLGGGGLFVPLFNLLLLFDTKTSAALSNFMILGGSMANLNLNLREHHPSIGNKPVIDFDLVLLLQPNMLLGISAGVILNVVLAEWIITAVLTLTLTVMTVHSFKSAVRRWDKETQQNSALQQAQAANGGIGYGCGSRVENGEGACGPACDEISPCVEPASDVYSIPYRGESGNLDGVDGSKSEEKQDGALLQPLLGAEGGPTFPTQELTGLALTWLAFFGIQVLRQGLPILPIKTCGVAYWLLTLTQVPLAMVITTWTIKRLRATHHTKQNPDVIQEVGFVLKPESCRRFAWMGLVAGVCGGMLGIGGGMIVNPMLLAVGILPQVTAATCALMVFFSSSMSVVQFWLMGRVPLEYALIFMVVSATFSLVGVRLVQRAIVKYNRASLIVFSVATVMGLSAVLMGLFGSWDTWQKYISGGYMGFHAPC